MKKSDAIKIIEKQLKEFNLFGKKKVEQEVPQEAGLKDRRINKVYSQFPKPASEHRSSDSPVNSGWSAGHHFARYADYTSLRKTPVNQEAPRRSTDPQDKDFSKSLGPNKRTVPVDLRSKGIDPFNYNKAKEQNYEFGTFVPWVRGTERRSKQDPRYKVKENFIKIIKEEVDKFNKDGYPNFEGDEKEDSWINDFDIPEDDPSLENDHMDSGYGEREVDLDREDRDDPRQPQNSVKWFDDHGYLIKDIPQEAINDCSGQGAADEAVKYWVKALNFNVPREQAIQYLKGFGAWDRNELNKWTNIELAERVLWIACGSLKDEADGWFGLVESKKKNKKKVIKEELSEKGLATVEKWIQQFGCREAAQKMINSALVKKCGLGCSDLPDTSTFANGIDAVEEALAQNDSQGAYNIAKEIADEMLEDEGFPMNESVAKKIIKEELKRFNLKEKEMK